MRNPPGISSSSASAGIWYYLWLKPNWKFVSLLGNDVNHVKLWSDELHLILAKHYRIRSKTKLGALCEAYRGMPRGRVVILNEMEYVIAHGNDFPHGMSPKNEIARVVSVFNLTAEYMRGKAYGKFENHETMLSEHQSAIEGLIGPVPY